MMLLVLMMLLSMPLTAQEAQETEKAQETEPTQEIQEAPQQAQGPMDLFIAFSRMQLTGTGFVRHEVDIDGEPLVWWEQGDGPSLVMIHGVSDQAGTWFQVASKLAAVRRVFLVDLPGHGESGPASGPLPMTRVMDGFVSWLAAHGVEEGESPPILVGNSMGAWVATTIAHRRPELVSRVVLVNGGPLRADTGELDLLPENREEARRLMAALRDPSNPPTPDYVLDDLVRRVPGGQVSRMFEATEDLESFLLDDDQLKDIGTPVDVLWGESDRYMGREYPDRLVAGFPAARLTLIPKCGHLPQAECPPSFLEKLEEVLAAPPPSPHPRPLSLPPSTPSQGEGRRHPPLPPPTVGSRGAGAPNPLPGRAWRVGPGEGWGRPAQGEGSRRNANHESQKVRMPMKKTLPLYLSLFFLLPALAMALDVNGGANQFAGGFAPSDAPWGGFGGGSCTASKTPVVFLHGNGDEAKNFDLPTSTGAASVYEAFIAAGYNDCELFGLNWLSSSERGLPQYNYHKPSKADLIADFLWDVKAYTGSSQVDVVAHSLGVTMALFAIDEDNMWSSVRRFIGIAGGMRGLVSCWWTGYANPLYPTCGSQNIFNSDIFGLYPHSWSTWNPRMGNGGFRDDPSGKSTLFYTIGADVHDEVLCGTASSVSGCGDSAVFDSRSNVRAQLDVGYGTTAIGLDFDLADWTIFNLLGGDADGVGHYRAKNNTGAIQVNMLTTSCTGTGCCAGYGDVCGNH